MKTLSVKNLKRSTRKLYHYNGVKNNFTDTTQTTGTDPTLTSVTLTSTSHIF